MSACPSRQQLWQHLNDELSGKAAVEVAAHLDAGCPSCDEEIRRMPNEPPEPTVIEENTTPYVTAPTPTEPAPAGYAIVGSLATGGMGEVVQARDLRLERRVALKTLRQDRRGLEQRFLEEARIAAQLQHPGIPPVHEVGTLPDGRPFLAMKLIQGDTLEALLQARSDPTADRGRFIAAFEQICQAVGYAHSRRVIHRDLKPLNVMVGAFGEVQVMDWGLAKVLTDEQMGGSTVDGTAQTEMHLRSKDSAGTMAGRALGTPGYMPPEQAVGALTKMGPRSDVFGLGGILASILTGKPPFASGSGETLKMQAAQGDVAECFARLDSCGADPELIALCKRCLAPRPEDRPADGAEVAREIAALRAAADERARRAEQERAVAEARAAEQRKRRRLTLLAGSAIVAVLIVGLAVSLWQMQRAIAAEVKASSESEAKDEALIEKSAALEAEKKARDQAFQALRSMTDEVVERKFAQGAVLTDEDKAFLRGVIAQYDAFAAIQGDDAESRAIRAEGRSRIGLMRQRLGELKEAEQDYDAALGIYKQLVAEFPDRPEFRQELGTCYKNRGRLQHATGRLEEAEQDYAAALGIRQRLAAELPTRPESRQELAEIHNNRGALFYAMGRLKEVEQDTSTALGIRQQLVAEFPSRPEFRRDLAASHLNRGTLLYANGKQKEAGLDFDAALDLLKQLVADFPTRPQFRQDLAMSFNSRGALLYAIGRQKEAEMDGSAALTIRKQLAEEFPTRPDYLVDLAKSHLNRGILLRDTGRLKEGEQDYDAALKIYKQLSADFPTRHEFRQGLAQCYDNHGSLLRTTGRLKEAAQDYNASLEIYKQLAADYPNQPDLRGELANMCVNLASLHQQRGEWPTAKKFLQEGQEHILTALKSSNFNPTYRQDYRRHLRALTCVHSGLMEKDQAVQTAFTRRDLGWDPPEDAYEAACFLSLCIPIVEKHAKLDEAKRKEQKQFYGDEAMKMLREAVKRGYKNTAQVKEDSDLAPLRERKDFQALLAEMEKKK